MIKVLHVAWLRAAALFTDSHQHLEAELQRMKEKNLAQEFIDQKDAQIQNLVEYYNQTDELIQAYRMALANAKTENHFLTEMLLKKISIDELVQYRPSAKLIIDKLETENLPQVLSELTRG